MRNGGTRRYKDNGRKGEREYHIFLGAMVQKNIYNAIYNNEWSENHTLVGPLQLHYANSAGLILDQLSLFSRWCQLATRSSSIVEASNFQQHKFNSCIDPLLLNGLFHSVMPRQPFALVADKKTSINKWHHVMMPEAQKPIAIDWPTGSWWHRSILIIRSIIIYKG